MAADYCINTLRYISDYTIDADIRINASADLQKYLTDESIQILPAQKKLMKAEIVPLMLSTTPVSIKYEYVNILMLLSKSDFPHDWPELLPLLDSSLQNAMVQVDSIENVVLILKICDLMFKRLTIPGNDNHHFDEYYRLFVGTLFLTFRNLSSKLDAATSYYQICSIVSAQRLCCRIVYSFTYHALPVAVSSGFQDLMNLFWDYLMSTHISVAHLRDASVLSHVYLLQAAVCDVLTRYVERQELMFSVEYANGLGNRVITLLEVSSRSPQDRGLFNVSALTFLASLAKSQTLHVLFSPQALRDDLITKVVLPCLMLTPDEEKLFHQNYRGFIKGNTLRKSRLRGACDLLSGLSLHYQQEIVQSVITQFNACLGSNNWRQKICAYNMVTYLQDDLVSQVVTTSVFFAQHVLPVLRYKDVNSYPMLKAAALKVFIALRHSIPKDVALTALNHLVTLLTSDANVVHSYAAICIQKLLDVKDDEHPRYSVSDIEPILEDLFHKLYSAREKSNSASNVFVSNCIEFVFNF